MISSLHKCELCDFVGSEAEADEHTKRNDGHVTKAMEEEPNPHGRKPQWYSCLEVDCEFEGTFEEWQEHQSAMGHHKYDIDEDGPPAEQTELFDQPGVIRRQLDIPVTQGFLDETKSRVVELLREKFDLEAAKDKANKEAGSAIKLLDTEIHTLMKVLKDPVTHVTVECEWRVCDDKPEKQLVRIDTDEVLETAALSEQERNAWETR